jgi:hypothetical protein
MLNRIFPFTFLLFVALACATGRVSNNRSQSGIARPKATPNFAAETTPQPKRSAWGYSEFDDEMGRGKVYHTSIQSTNTISLGFPYEGEQYGILALREHPEYGKDVYIRIEKGQLLDSDYHGKVLVRFDDDKPLAFSSVKPADLSSETLFLRGRAFQIFVNRLKTAKTLRMEVPVYQAGNQIFLFDVEGFTWKDTKR